MSFGTTTVGGLDMTNFVSDTVVEGLRIPPLLNSSTAVNFVLTQEKGKLKPKDLKAAIERNRADKKKREEEQEKIRAEGGGVGPGMLDLRSILADDRLNLVEGDAFKRQLREMAFLADVDDVQKLEVEKGFRISEVYIGSPHLSVEDIETVKKQREEAALFKKRNAWRTVQQRQVSGIYGPVGTTHHAGAGVALSKEILNLVSPKFDANRNDIWAKRMNTLRRFMSLVSRWIMRKRVTDRIRKIKETFEAAGAFTKPQVLEFINLENVTYRSKGGGGSTSVANRPSSSVADRVEWADTNKENRKASNVGELVCAMPNEVLIKRFENESIISREKYEVTSDMVKRVLFPKYVADETSQRVPMEPPSAKKSDWQFDDKTYFQLKVRPEYLTLKYEPHEVPISPIIFASHNDKSIKLGAPEEYTIRYPADLHVSPEDILSLNPASEIEPEEMSILWKGMPKSCTGELMEAGEWLSSEPTWNSNASNYFRARPEFRTYNSVPMRTEIQSDYSLRPFAEQLRNENDTSLRTLWSNTPGFLSTNVYMLGASETRDCNIPVDVLPPPPPGPSLTDFYFPDHDRHISGLNCQALDHHRSKLEGDLDVLPLQHRQDPADHLTDSESDDEDAYVAPKPSMARIREMLYPPSAETETPLVSPAASKKGGAVVSTNASVVSMSSDPAPLLELEEKTNEQVELLRDRKILDMESYLLKKRQNDASSITARLAELSTASACLLHAIPVQLPFHQYENEVYELEETRKEQVTTSFIEPAPVSMSETKK